MLKLKTASAKSVHKQTYVSARSAAAILVSLCVAGNFVKQLAATTKAEAKSIFVYAANGPDRLQVLRLLSQLVRPLVALY